MEIVDAPALLLLDLPPAALAGIDLLSFTATPKFRGIKNLPPGFHFAFVGASTAFSERHGVWFEIPPSSKTSDHPLIVTKWDSATETLRLVTDEAEVLRQRANLGTIWREGLAPYRQQATNLSTSTDTTQEELCDWPSLTSSLTRALIDRITGDGHLSSSSSAPADLEPIPGLPPAADLNHPDPHPLHFLPIDLKQTWPPGATGRERTTAARDRSWALDNLLTHHCGRSAPARDLLGELQLAFIATLTLNNFSALAQWKRLLGLVLTCRAAVAPRADFFAAALATLRLQVRHCRDAEGGLIDLAEEGGGWLQGLLVRFRRGVEALTSSSAHLSADAEGDLQSVLDELEDLEALLQREHGWQFGGAFARRGVLALEDGEEVRGVETSAWDEEDETGEFAPAVVELTGEQRRLLGVEGDEEVVLHERLEGTRLGGGERREGGGGGLQVEEASTGSEDEDEDKDGTDESGSSGEEMHDLDDMDARF